MPHEIPLSTGDQIKVRLPSAAECHTYSLIEGEPVIEIRRWNGATEIHGGRGTEIVFVPVKTEPGQESLLAKWQQIVDDLRQTIVAGRLRPGDQVPTEEQMVVKYGVNRTTVRSALAAVHELGLIEVNHPQGVYVVDQKHE